MHEFWNVPAVHQNATVKDWCIKVLSEEWPLALKQVHERIEAKSGKTVSQQAVFKTLLGLVTQSVVEKIDKRYALNKEWIQYLSKSVQRLVNTYENQTSRIDAANGFANQAMITFNDPNSVSTTLAKVFAARLLTNGKEKPMCSLKRHALWPLRFNFRDFELLKAMARANPCYTAIIADTPFDRWIAKQYRKGGFKKVKTGVKANIPEQDILVHGDVLVQLKYSKPTEELIEALYRQVKNIEEVFELYSQQEFEKVDFQATLTIQKNADLALLTREKIIKLLEE